MSVRKKITAAALLCMCAAAFSGCGDGKKSTKERVADATQEPVSMNDASWFDGIKTVALDFGESDKKLSGDKYTVSNVSVYRTGDDCEDVKQVISQLGIEADCLFFVYDINVPESSDYLNYADFGMQAVFDGKSYGLTSAVFADDAWHFIDTGIPVGTYKVCSFIADTGFDDDSQFYFMEGDGSVVGGFSVKIPEKEEKTEEEQMAEMGMKRMPDGGWALDESAVSQEGAEAVQ